ncbi:META domain-containing protein [Neptunomonas sp.]|uniref:META domain-containing protein n=1 Tax=Neptunomonas sp. TaxID=1971898 RepID=UPI0035677D63
MLRIVCIILFSFLAVSCKTTPVNTTPHANKHSYPVTSLKNSSWNVPSVASRGLMDYPKLTFTFKETEISGFSGCNRFRGSYTVLDSRLEIDELITTRKLCSKVVMFQEYLLLNELKKTLVLSMTDNRVIQLTNNTGEVTILSMQ